MLPSTSLDNVSPRSYRLYVPRLRETLMHVAHDGQHFCFHHKTKGKAADIIILTIQYNTFILRGKCS